jgi:cyclophilin family peptidyl-prolyl cis-trans isomerase
MVLNPTNNPLLNEHAENMVAYVNAGRYHCTVINRAAEGFVLQMGGFGSRTQVTPGTVDGFIPVETFDPVQGAPASTIQGLTNSVGTVALALPGDGMGGTNQDAGTSSFFVNLTDNSFLDSDFTTFAVIPNLTTINTIMNLSQVDLSLDPAFGAGPNDLAFIDVPLLDDGRMVFIQRAFVIEDTAAVTAARNAAIAGLIDPSSLSAMLNGPNPAPTFQQGIMTNAAAANLNTAAANAMAASASTSAVPEPTSAVMVLIGAAFGALRFGRYGSQARRG